MRGGRGSELHSARPVGPFGYKSTEIGSIGKAVMCRPRGSDSSDSDPPVAYLASQAGDCGRLAWGAVDPRCGIDTPLQLGQACVCAGRVVLTVIRLAMDKQSPSRRHNVLGVHARDRPVEELVGGGMGRRVVP